MQKITLIGIGGGFALLMVGIIMDGTSPGALLQIPALLIVVVPTVMVSLAGLSGDDISLVQEGVKKAFAGEEASAGDSISTVVKFAEQARKEGLLALEESAKTIDDPFLKKGIDLAVDGTDPEELRDILESELYAKKAHDKHSAKFFADAGAYAPTIGIIGTVMGLVHVLQNLSAPATLGPSISSAFIATLMGVASANVIYLPVANRMKAMSAAEVELRTLTLEGILSVQAGDNPRVVSDKLTSFVAPAERSGGDADNVTELPQREAEAA
jgi:chemotaxis protein MotA